MNTTVLFLILFSALYVALILLAHRGKAARGGGLTEFFVSGRDLGLGTAIATLGATEIGLITIAYNAQKGFNEGFAAFHIGLAALVGCAFVGLFGFVVKPIRRTGVLTLPEYYEVRFGRDIRIFGAIVMALGGILKYGPFLEGGGEVPVCHVGRQWRRALGAHLDDRVDRHRRLLHLLWRHAFGDHHGYFSVRAAFGGVARGDPLSHTNRLLRCGGESGRGAEGRGRLRSSDQ